MCRPIMYGNSYLIAFAVVAVLGARQGGGISDIDID